ncbi:MAG TPA: SWIM zinc finger family protein [Streptosporangiaceae bacterium]|nr:SWIM zinc finger family protein [Streptosporangiaceae bacterium]
MSESGNGFYPPSRPIRADGGIRARSKRGSIGEQWWSRRFIDVLESFGLQSRLSRGRNYARSGQVRSLDVGTGHVTATVQGSRVRPYSVKLTVDPLTTRQWRRVTEALAARAIFRARLLAGEMPAEIEEVFADCGTPLFPRSARDLAMTCSCPDWEVTCKHVAAVCYVLAEAFDDDPFAMLAWRGKGRADLLAALRQLSAGAGAGAADGGAAGGRPVIDVADRPLAQCTAGFWSSSLSPARLRSLPPATAAPPDLLLRSIEPPLLTAGGMDLITLLRPAYQLLGGEAAGDSADAADTAGTADASTADAGAGTGATGKKARRRRNQSAVP